MYTGSVIYYSINWIYLLWFRVQIRLMNLEKLIPKRLRRFLTITKSCY